MIAHRFSAAAAILTMLAASSLGCSTTEDAQTPPSPDGGSDARPNKPSDSGPDDGSDDEVDGGRDGGTDSGDGGPKCKAPTDCPAPANECIEVTCTAGECGEKPKPAGTAVSTQTAGDCQKNECDGDGKIHAVDDDTDVPNDDDACTQDRCAGGEPEHANVSDGTACGANLTCVNGACTGCATANDCPGTDDECKTRTCSAGKCGVAYTENGTPLAAQVAGDCKMSVCDGAGNSTTINDDADLPADDGSQCTNEVCNAGMPSHANEPKGLACNQNGGTLCNGAGVCVAPACDDEIQNGNETDVDCGGVCGVCANGRGCGVDGDCASGKCTGNSCQAPTCTDGVKNGNETGVDCGGSCDPCPGSLTTLPSDGATDVAVSTTIAITFSTAMDTATLTAQAATGACSGSIRVSADGFDTCIGFNAPLAFSDGNKVVTPTPPTALTHETTYKIRVTNAAQDAQGGAFTQYTSATGFTTAAPPAPVQCTGSQVVISQVYGGGGNSGAQYLNDFIELHNRGNSPVTLTGWSVVYASNTGTAWNNNKTDLSGSIAPGGYFLVQGRSGSSGAGEPLPTPDVVGNIDLSGSNGKVALVRGAAGSDRCATNAVDYVSYGSGNCSEGGEATPALNNTTAAIRKNGGCTDTNNNKSDFETGAPTPRNASSSAVTCGCAPF